MPTVDEHGRPEPEPAVGEIATLSGFLEFQRATLEWKTRGLDESALRRRLPPSSMTLGGLLNHMAWVEDHWFSYVLVGNERHPDWSTGDSAADPDGEWNQALTMDAESLRTRWAVACAESRSHVDRFLAAGDAGSLAARTWTNGEAPNLRWILVHMIEEYSRHNGHADLLREAIDGRTGE